MQNEFVKVVQKHSAMIKRVGRRLHSSPQRWAWKRAVPRVWTLVGIAVLVALAGMQSPTTGRRRTSGERRALLFPPEPRDFAAKARSEGFTGEWGSALLNVDADAARSAKLNKSAHAHPWNACRGDEAWLSGGAEAWGAEEEEHVDEAGIWEALTHNESARYRGAAKGGGPAVTARVATVPCARAGAAKAHGCCSRTFSLRPGTTDANVYSQIYLGHFLRLVYPLADAVAPRYILDAGANAGFSSVLFALLWPDAVIVALEPDASNYAALVAQVADLPQVRPMHAGLWGRRARVGVADSSGGEWGLVFAELPPTNDSSADGSVDAYSVSDVAALFDDVSAFDFVKIDIEGAEGVVFAPGADLSWVNAVQVVSLEVHDWFAGHFGLSDASSVIHDAMARRRFDVVTDNEHIYYLAASVTAALGLA